jgi:hypothetical protein
MDIRAVLKARNHVLKNTKESILIYAKDVSIE